MFSFFRREKPEDLMTFLKEGQPEFEPGPTYNKSVSLGENLGIEVTEALGGLSPQLEEAAVLYANGKIGDAAALLNRFLLDYPDVRDPQPWYMLFDLYEASDQAAPFEDAAVDFAVKFERSPPTWTPRGKPRVPLSPAPTMSYGERYGSAERVRQQRFFQEVQGAPFVRLDVSRTQTPEEETAQAILSDIVHLHEMKMPIELIGGPGFAVRLNAARQGDRLTESGWFLLLAVLQILSKEDDFENVAVDYAIAHEVSPPSYTPPRAIPDRNASEFVQPPSGTTFCMRGVVGPGNESQVRELAEFADGLQQLEIDLSGVTRIDFAVVGLLLESLIDISNKGCKVLFKEGNELVNILLQIVGAGQFAAIFGTYPDLMEQFHGTTILCVRRGDRVAMGGDGQVTLGNIVIKAGARKVRKLYHDRILAGFAGSTADAFTLSERFESKLEKHQGHLLRSAVELAKDWRTDRMLRRLEAMLAVADQSTTLIITGSGDVLEPEYGIAAIGSGGAYAQAAARALIEHSEMAPEAVVREALGIAADICIYTNRNFSLETL